MPFYCHRKHSLYAVEMREWNLVCIAHNLKVMWRKLKENVGILSDILKFEVEFELEHWKFLNYHAISGYLSRIRLQSVLTR